MCIKIVSSEKIQEFDISKPLLTQLSEANHISVKYDPQDLNKIECFVSEMEKMVKNGASPKFQIEVDPKNYLDGCRLRTKIKKLKFQLEVNEVIKKLALIYSETDKKVLEIAETCLMGKR